MKTCEEMTASLLHRRDSYYRERRKKARIIGASAAGCLIVGVGVLSLARGIEPPAAVNGTSPGSNPAVIQTQPAGNGDPGSVHAGDGQSGSPVVQSDICHHIITEKEYASVTEAGCYVLPQVGETVCTIGLREAMKDYEYDPKTIFVVQITLFGSDGSLSSADDLELYRAEANRINQSYYPQDTWLEAVLCAVSTSHLGGVDSDADMTEVPVLSGAMSADQIHALAGGTYGYFVELGDFAPETATAE